ncbi:MAG: glycosyltransferase, partial [Mycetocola sp.]
FTLTATEPERKERLLFYPGGMRPNGITVSILNLLARLDYDRFDVTVICAKPRSAAEARTQALIDPRARLLLRVGGMNGSKITQLVRRVFQRPGLIRIGQRMRSQQRLWQAEAERCFGDAHFDRAIDFSGYAQFWAQLILAAPASQRSIWLHNDLCAEARRPVNGKTPMKRSLGAVAELYASFDSLVSVSPALSQINESSFRRIAPRSRFTSARNVMAITPPSATADEENGPWLRRMAEPDTFWFISVGRYSAEKNQERLIRAFARVHAERPDTRLILVGYGPLQSHLEKVIADLGLNDAAFLTGALSTPLQLMEASDAFVLSSDWEGQPMVLLEAATVGLPIVSVAFGSVSSALPGDELHIVERTVPALADGLRAAHDGRVAVSRLDVEEYNSAALAEFVSAINEDSSAPAAASR